MADIKVGDNVEWNSRNGKTEGKVTKKITRDGNVGEHTVHASADDPQFEVTSSKTGKKAAHKPGSLSKN